MEKQNTDWEDTRNLIIKNNKDRNKREKEISKESQAYNKGLALGLVLGFCIALLSVGVVYLRN